MPGPSSVGREQELRLIRANRRFRAEVVRVRKLHKIAPRVSRSLWRSMLEKRKAALGASRRFSSPTDRGFEWVRSADGKSVDLPSALAMLQEPERSRELAKLKTGRYTATMPDAETGRFRPFRFVRRRTRANLQLRAKREAERSWESYSAKLTSEDIAFVRRTVGLSPAWDASIRHFILFDQFESPDVLPFGGIRIHLLPSGGAVASGLLELRGIDEPRLFVEISRDTPSTAILDAWPTIRRLQKSLPGRGPARRKPNFGRDAMYSLKLERGKKAKQAFDELGHLGSNDVEPEALRQALHRRKKRLA